MHRILDAGFLLFHLRLRGGPDLDHRDAADELRQPLLQFFPVVIRGHILDLGAKLFDAPLDCLFCRRLPR